MMRTFFLTLFGIALSVAGGLAQRTTSAELEEAARSIDVWPREGKLSAGTSIRVSFPTAMVPLESIGAEGEEPPFDLSPALEGTFSWQSATEARFRVSGPVRPGQSYRLTLPAGLADAQEKLVSLAAWKPVVFETEPMVVKSRFQSVESALVAQPSVDIRVNYAVTPDAIAEAAYFLNRDTRARFPVAVVLPLIQTDTVDEAVEPPGEVTRFSVSPVAPLPVDGTYDLVVEGLKDAGTGTAMPGLKAVALGRTQALEVLKVRVHTDPLRQPEIELMTSGPIDGESLTADDVLIEPSVEGFTASVNVRGIRLQGDFDVSQTYRVTLGSSVKSKTGYPLASRGPFEAVFDGLNPAIYFPQGQFYQRAALGLHVTVLQANSPEISWKLVRVPWEKLHVVRQRLKEFEGREQDPFTGRDQGPYQTELLSEALSLPTVAEGSLPGVSKGEALYREIRWKPDEGTVPPGAYVLEASASLLDGRVIGNRSLLYFNEVVVHRKLTADDMVLRVCTMETGWPIPGAEVEVIDKFNVLLARGTTDGEGRLVFDRRETEGQTKKTPSYILVKSDQGGGVQPYRGARFFNSGWVSHRHRSNDVAGHRELASSVFADRSLYRPGDPVQVKGTLRWRSTDASTGAYRFSIPRGQISWSVHQGYNGPALESGVEEIDAFGGWEARWTPPKTAKLGQYRLRARLGDSTSAGTVYFRVEEYKPPLFTVELEPQPGERRMRIASHYFHGSPNAGAGVRWVAHWSPSHWQRDGFHETDYTSPHRRETVSGLIREGELRLDADGLALVDLEVPYPKPWSFGTYRVHFSVEVLAPEGQVVEAAENLRLRPHPIFPSIRMDRASDEEPGSRDLIVQVRATDDEGEWSDGVSMQLTIFRRETRTVKERLGPKVYRYRNYPLFHVVEERAITSGSSHRFTPVETGHYVAYATLADGDDSMVSGVSEMMHSLGRGAGRYHVSNDGQITLQLDKERYVAGRDTASIALEAPFGGQAWVCVETDGIIDQFLVELPENNHPITLPIKPAYYPNVHVSVSLLRPGGPDRLPQERYGTVRLEVDRPDLKLEVGPELAVSEVQAGEEVRGVVRVRCQGQPVLGADVTVFAVDDSVHRLGDWRMPDWLAAMYPGRRLEVASFRGLDEHFMGFEEREVTEKGFLIGGGGEEMAARSGADSGKTFRKDFRALAFWKSRLATDAEGEASYEFLAPDNLTRFHLVAVAQTKSHQFGQGETSFTVSKRLMVEPALTRFVRKGDHVELRAVLRQDYVDETPVLVRCTVEGEIEWLSGEQERSLSLVRGLPQVVRFPCRVTGGETMTVRFQAEGAHDPSLADAVEVALPVRPAGILQRTGHFGVIARHEAVFPLHEKLPEHWAGSEGHFRTTVSYTPFLPELRSLPEILEYPHGCLEQKSTRYLTYSLLAGLLDYLPALGERRAHYEERIREGLATYDRAMLGSGFIPYWEGSGSANDWVTLMAYWMMESAQAEGIPVPPRLDSGLQRAHAILANGRREYPKVSLTTRAFALFVHAETGHTVEGMEGLLTDLYGRRDDLGVDGLTLLTLAMQGYGVMGREQKQLGKVLQHEAKGRQPRAFDPVTFGSSGRDRALRWLTRVRLASGGTERRKLADAYLKASEAYGNVLLSTQEHFWKALLLREFVQMSRETTFPAGGLEPRPDFVSENGVSLAWRSLPLNRLSAWALALGEGGAERYYMVNARVMRGADSTQNLEDRGFRLERTVANLTDSGRLGTEGAPFAIGDELLLTYRFHAKQHQHYVALSDELPAGLEAVNFNLPQVASLYRLPDGVRSTLHLDHSELRDQSAHLYFDEVPAGAHVYAILARVTANGTFAWPSAEIAAMYQPYVGGLSASRVAHSRHEG